MLGDVYFSMARGNAPSHAIYYGRVVLSASCTMIHTTVDLVNETKLDKEKFKSWLAFTEQKVPEAKALVSLVHFLKFFNLWVTLSSMIKLWITFALMIKVKVLSMFIIFLPHETENA
ncbi:hypothetical protein SLA2020_300880 [Shorea laevis]